MIAHTLVACFHQRNTKAPLRGRLTLIAAARQILLGVISVSAGDVAWLRRRSKSPPL